MACETFYDYERNVIITAEELILPDTVTFGVNVQIKVRGLLKFGKYSRFGDNVKINGQEVIFGDHLRRYGIRIYTTRPFGKFIC